MTHVRVTVASVFRDYYGKVYVLTLGCGHTLRLKQSAWPKQTHASCGVCARDAKERAATIACPKCAAPGGAACVGTSGPRVRMHEERVVAAVRS